jgi:hypothetical protein
MAQRLKAVLVSFDDDIREDDAEAVIQAIRMIRRVASVGPVPADIDDHLARQRARLELVAQLWDVLK